MIAKALDADFERRWTDWKARGLAHERLVRYRFVTGVSIAAVLAFAALLAYGFGA
jgi:hypothetical protein